MPNPGQPTIAPGAAGSVVRRLQRALRRTPNLGLSVDGRDWSRNGIDNSTSLYRIYYRAHFVVIDVRAFPWFTANVSR